MKRTRKHPRYERFQIRFERSVRVAQAIDDRNETYAYLSIPRPGEKVVVTGQRRMTKRELREKHLLSLVRRRARSELRAACM